jgi:hypothetical protein
MFRAEKYNFSHFVWPSQGWCSCNVIWINTPELELESSKLLLWRDSNFAYNSQFHLFAVSNMIEIQIPITPNSPTINECPCAISSTDPKIQFQRQLRERLVTFLLRGRIIHNPKSYGFHSPIASLNIRNHLEGVGTSSTRGKSCSSRRAHSIDLGLYFLDYNGWWSVVGRVHNDNN